jgi:hypothetical protein
VTGGMSPRILFSFGSPPPEPPSTVKSAFMM